MKHLLLSLCLLATLFSGFSQSTERSIVKQYVYVASAKFKPGSVKQYNYWVNQAELAICNDNLKLADSLFTTAFSIKKPLAREMRTAFWVAIQTENNEKILQMAKCRIELGDVELSDSYRNMSANFDSSVHKKLLYLDENTPKSYHTEFDTIIENLLERDQLYRMQGQGRCPEQFALDDENRAKIKQFYRDYPEFNEYVAGFYYLSQLSVAMLHAVQTEHYDLQPILRKKVAAGIFPPQQYMELEDVWSRIHFSSKKMYGGGGMGNENIYYIGNTLFVTRPENLKQINKNRKKLGVFETWEDAVKKCVWECEHNCYCITGNRNLKCFGDEEDDAAEATKLKQEIDAEHAKGDFHRMYYERGQSK